MRRSRLVVALAVLVLSLAVIASVYVIRKSESGTGTTSSGSRFYGSSSARTFFWGGNPRGPFTTGEIQQIARSRSIVVISPQHDHFDLAGQERDARRLKAVNPKLKVLFYLNTKHYLYESRHPKLTTGFDPTVMALHDRAGLPIPFKPTTKNPDGSGLYVDNASPAWQDFYLRTAAQIMRAGDFDGIAMDSLRPLTDPMDKAAIAELDPSEVTAWNAGQIQLLVRVKAAFPGKMILYNGISPAVKHQTNRNLAPLQIADATLNEAFCVERNEVEPKNLLAEIPLMGAAARQGKVILEKVNYDPVHEWSAGQLKQFEQRNGDLCLGAFLLGYVPGSTFFDFSDAYGLSQLASNPDEISLSLGAPTGTYIRDRNLLHRNFQHGQVYVNFGTTAAVVKFRSAAMMVDDRRIVAQFARGEVTTLGPLSSAFLIDGGPRHR